MRASFHASEHARAILKLADVLAMESEAFVCVLNVVLECGEAVLHWRSIRNVEVGADHVSHFV